MFRSFPHSALPARLLGADLKDGLGQVLHTGEGPFLLTSRWRVRCPVACQAHGRTCVNLHGQMLMEAVQIYNREEGRHEEEVESLWVFLRWCIEAAEPWEWNDTPLGCHTEQKASKKSSSY